MARTGWSASTRCSTSTRAQQQLVAVHPLPSRGARLFPLGFRLWARFGLRLVGFRLHPHLRPLRWARPPTSSGNPVRRPAYNVESQKLIQYRIFSDLFLRFSGPLPGFPACETIPRTVWTAPFHPHGTPRTLLPSGKMRRRRGMTKPAPIFIPPSSRGEESVTSGHFSPTAPKPDPLSPIFSQLLGERVSGGDG